MKKIATMAFVWILIVEVSLHVTAFSLRTWMEHKQEVALQASSQVKILCIGESTTAWGADQSYPMILQKRLNALYPGKYQVFNKAIPGANTLRTLNAIPEFLEEVEPQIVIVMAGVNDYWGTIDKDAAFWESALLEVSQYSRIAKIFRNVLVNLKYGVKDDNEMSREADCGGHNTEIDNFLGQTKELEKKGDVKEAITFLEEKIKLLTPKGSCSIASPLQMKLISYQEIDLNNPKLALSTVNKILKTYMIPHVRSGFLTKKNELHRKLGLDVVEEVNAANYWKNSTYKVNIQNIIGEIQARSTPVIMMQYPRLPIEPLKEILIRHHGVTFVENKNNFEDALKTKKYDDIFYDKFGLIFGHFKPIGAEMIVDNVIGAIIKQTETQVK